MIEAALFTILSTNAGVGALVGGTGTAARVWPLILPQQPTLPAVSFTRISTTGRQPHHSGHVRVVEPRFQFSCFASTPLAAKQLAAAVIAALTDFSGDVGDEQILSTEFANEADDFDTGIGAFMVPVDFFIKHRTI